MVSAYVTLANKGQDGSVWLGVARRYLGMGNLSVCRRTLCSFRLLRIPGWVVHIIAMTLGVLVKLDLV
jgi:hypothetical protein